MTFEQEVQEYWQTTLLPLAKASKTVSISLHERVQHGSNLERVVVLKDNNEVETTGEEYRVPRAVECIVSYEGTCEVNEVIGIVKARFPSKSEPIIGEEDVRALKHQTGLRLSALLDAGVDVTFTGYGLKGQLSYDDAQSLLAPELSQEISCVQSNWWSE